MLPWRWIRPKLVPNPLWRRLMRPWIDDSSGKRNGKTGWGIVMRLRKFKEAQENSPVLLRNGSLLEAIERMRGEALCRSVLHLLEKQILPLMAASA